VPLTGTLLGQVARGVVMVLAPRRDRSGWCRRRCGSRRSQVDCGQVVVEVVVVGGEATSRREADGGKQGGKGRSQARGNKGKGVGGGEDGAEVGSADVVATGRSRSAGRWAGSRSVGVQGVGCLYVGRRTLRYRSYVLLVRRPGRVPARRPPGRFEGLGGVC